MGCLMAVMPIDGMKYAEEEEAALDDGDLKTAGELLREAAGLVEGKRDRTHGSKLTNFSNIAGLWNGFLHDVLKRPLRPSEAALMMELMKVARTKTGDHNLDDYRDQAGYAGCAGELAEIETAEDFNG